MWKIIKWPIIYLVVQLFLIILFAYYFVSNGNNPNLFGDFLNSNKIYMILIISIVFIPLLLFNYKKFNIKEEKINIKTSLLLIILGIIISLIYNNLAYYIDLYFLKSNLFSTNNISLTIIITLILGPIIEELIFRGIMYNEAKKIYSNMKSILIVTTIFALFHFNILQIVYAFALGFLLIFVYEKYKSLKAPIILHITSNVISALYTIYFIKYGFIFNYIIFIMSITLLFIIKKYFLSKKI